MDVDKAREANWAEPLRPPVPTHLARAYIDASDLPE